jgi:hypothetical protein
MGCVAADRRAIERLLILPYCPDHAVSVGFSGSFARCLGSGISERHDRALMRSRPYPGGLGHEGVGCGPVQPVLKRSDERLRAAGKVATVALTACHLDHGIPY